MSATIQADAIKDYLDLQTYAFTHDVKREYLTQNFSRSLSKTEVKIFIMPSASTVARESRSKASFERSYIVAFLAKVDVINNGISTAQVDNLINTVDVVARDLIDIPSLKFISLEVLDYFDTSQLQIGNFIASLEATYYDTETIN